MFNMIYGTKSQKDGPAKRVLVAGATGYLGGFVARELATRGYSVRALVRFPKKLDHLRTSLDEVAEAEVTQPETLDHVCDGIDVGGPQVVTRNQAASLGFEALGRPARISHIPEWLMWSVLRLVRLFNRHQGDLLAYFSTMATSDVVAPPVGTHSIEALFRSLVEAGGEE